MSCCGSCGGQGHQEEKEQEQKNAQAQQQEQKLAESKAGSKTESSVKNWEAAK